MTAAKLIENPRWTCGCSWNGKSVMPHNCPRHGAAPIIEIRDRPRLIVGERPPEIFRPDVHEVSGIQEIRRIEREHAAYQRKIQIAWSILIVGAAFLLLGALIFCAS